MDMKSAIMGPMNTPYLLPDALKTQHHFAILRHKGIT